MANIQALTMRNAERWVAAKLTRGKEFGPVAKKLVAAKARYQAIEAKTGVPWFVIAVIHQRESSQNFERSLAQGDPWNKVSTHVPAGRGPFPSFEAAAIDALVNCAPYAARHKDWSPGAAMTMLEQYNGLGYANKGIPSPYIWSGTDQYAKGKYIADRVFDPSAVDKQLGCAGLILAMQALDSSIKFALPPGALPPPAAPPPPPDVEPVPTPAPGTKPEVKPLRKSKTIWGGILQWLAGVVATFAGMFQYIATPWGFAVMLLIIASISLGLYLVIKGRIDVNKIVKHLSQEEG